MKKLSPLWQSGLILTLVFSGASRAVPHGKKDWPAPEEAKKLKNPLPAGEATLRVAKAIYDAKCGQCHGDLGKGDGPESIMYDVKPADLTDARMMNSMSDGEIFWKISEGRQPMPSFRKQLTEEQRWQLVHFLRTFAPQQAPKPPGKKPGKAGSTTRKAGEQQH